MGRNRGQKGEKESRYDGAGEWVVYRGKGKLNGRGEGEKEAKGRKRKGGMTMQVGEWRSTEAGRGSEEDHGKYEKKVGRIGIDIITVNQRPFTFLSHPPPFLPPPLPCRRRGHPSDTYLWPAVPRPATRIHLHDACVCRGPLPSLCPDFTRQHLFCRLFA